MSRITIRLDIQPTLAPWRRLRGLSARLEAAAKATAENLALRRTVDASVLLAGDARVRRLNHDFRGINHATNVLSFPQFSPEDLRRELKSKKPFSVGDIAVGYPYVAYEAKKEDKILLDHVTHLVVHGLLHLFGYDHQNDREARRMEKKEIAIMKALGLPDPYARAR